MERYTLNIKRYRKAKVLKQKELADMVGISQSFLIDLECQKYPITLNLLWKIASVLEVCPFKLINCNECIGDLLCERKRLLE